MMHHLRIVQKYYQLIHIISKVYGLNNINFAKYFLFLLLALFRRASCLLAKKQYEEAKRDLDLLLSVDQNNNEAKVSIFSLKKAATRPFSF